MSVARSGFNNSAYLRHDFEKSMVGVSSTNYHRTISSEFSSKPPKIQRYDGKSMKSSYPSTGVDYGKTRDLLFH